MKMKILLGFGWEGVHVTKYRASLLKELLYILSLGLPETFLELCCTWNLHEQFFFLLGIRTNCSKGFPHPSPFCLFYTLPVFCLSNFLPHLTHFLEGPEKHTQQWAEARADLMWLRSSEVSMTGAEWEGGRVPERKTDVDAGQTAGPERHYGDLALSSKEDKDLFSGFWSV